MTIVGFNFTSIKAERKSQMKGKINIENNVKIENITESQLVVGDKSMKTLAVEFSYSSVFTPNIGEVLLTGSLIYMNDPKKIDEVLKGWKSKDKKVPDDVMQPIINTILKSCTIMSLRLTQEVNLPPSYKLPEVDIKKK